MVKWLNTFKKLAGENSLYILLLIFIMVFNVLIAVSTTPEERARAREVSQVMVERKGAFDKTEELMMTRRELEKALAKRPHISLALNLAGLLFILVLVLGFLFDAIFLSFKFRRIKLDVRTYSQSQVSWSIWDVAKVVVLFLFFAYVIIVLESFLQHAFPIFKRGNFRMMLNSSILDTFAAAAVIYFAVYKYKGTLTSLGLTIKNALKNIFYGMVGYIACVPIFLGTAFFVFLVVKLVGYTPERQPVVELFLKEENPTFLVYSSMFASIFGPFVEELFFRGFMYNALKKLAGVFWAIALTAAVFAALHTNVVGFLPIMVLGVLLTYMYEKTGSLVPSITIHVIHNLIMVFFVFLIKELRSL